jgi:hypothetical protein
LVGGTGVLVVVEVGVLVCGTGVLVGVLQAKISVMVETPTESPICARLYMLKIVFRTL